MRSFWVLNKYCTHHAFPFFLRRVRKIAKSDCQLRFIRLSVRMEQLGSQWTDFHEICYLGTFGKSVGENSSLFKIRQ
jgi:hypothetical protein